MRWGSEDVIMIYVSDFSGRINLLEVYINGTLVPGGQELIKGFILFGEENGL